MKILPAVQLQRVLDKGGSTKPWLVELLEASDVLAPYVVKVFTPRQIQQQNAVAKEVYGNVLAKALILPVPDCVLAQFSPEFAATLPDEAQAQHARYDRGLHFASEYQAGFTIIGDQLPKSKIWDYEPDSVYAFDNLIRNLDRGGERKKPNFLIRDDDYLLIDHELIFPFADDPDHPDDTVIRAFRRGEWHYRYEKHLFYPQLKNCPVVRKSKLFVSFAERLVKLDPTVLEEPARFLNEHGHPIGAIELITEYLYAVQSNPDAFVRILQQQIAR